MPEKPFPRKSWSVQGYSKDILRGPLFDVDDVDKIVVRDKNGKPVVAIVKINDDVFIEGDASQKDWESFCLSRGIM